MCVCVCVCIIIFYIMILSLVQDSTECCSKVGEELERIWKTVVEAGEVLSHCLHGVTKENYSNSQY